MKIKKLSHWKKGDDAEIRHIDNLCLPGDTSYKNNEEYHWWVVQVKDLYGEDRIVAFASLRVDPRGEAHFTRCAVLPSVRGLGIQTKLIKARLKWLRSKGIKVVRTYASRSNHHSVRNLRAAGFTERISPCGKYLNFRKDLA